MLCPWPGTYSLEEFNYAGLALPKCISVSVLYYVQRMGQLKRIQNMNNVRDVHTKLVTDSYDKITLCPLHGEYDQVVGISYEPSYHTSP